MTAAQSDRLYFPLWRLCAKANNWVMAGGRLAADLINARACCGQWPEPARAAMLTVLDYAERLAAQEWRGLTTEDLRHACNLLATGGRLASHRQMTNRQTNRVVALFKLLKDPDDLQAVMDWLEPGEVDARSLVAWLRRQAPEATLRAISQNAFYTSEWQGLSRDHLRWILSQVKDRKAKFARPVVTTQERE